MYVLPCNYQHFKLSRVFLPRHSTDNCCSREGVGWLILTCLAVGLLFLSCYVRLLFCPQNLLHVVVCVLWDTQWREPDVKQSWCCATFGDTFPRFQSGTFLFKSTFFVCLGDWNLRFVFAWRWWWWWWRRRGWIPFLEKMKFDVGNVSF